MAWAIGLRQNTCCAAPSLNLAADRGKRRPQIAVASSLLQAAWATFTCGRTLCANMTETPTPPAITDFQRAEKMRHHGKHFEAEWRFPHDRVGSPEAEGGRAERARP